MPEFQLSDSVENLAIETFHKSMESGTPSESVAVLDAVQAVAPLIISEGNDELRTAYLAYRERRVLEMEDQGKTIEEIATAFQVVPERIRQISVQAKLRLGMELSGSESTEAELRLADVWSVVQSAYPFGEDGLVDEDKMEAIEEALGSVGLGGFFSALQHAFGGSSGCVEPEEWEKCRRDRLEQMRIEEQLDS